MILVTGATGLVGTYLLSVLSKKEDRIRAMYRTDQKLEHAKSVFLNIHPKDASSKFENIEWIKGDITDVVSLEAAFKNITVVYHCAALISFDPADYQKLRKVNIEGTANIVNQCILHNVKTLCHVSSIATMGKGIEESLIDESTEWNAEKKHSVYAITKYGAEMEVWRGSQEGVKVIIVNPGIIVGAGFFNSGSGYFFKKVNRGLTYYTTGTTGFVAASDVALCMVTLVEKKVYNDRFILTAENWSFQKFFISIANALQKPAPKKSVKKYWMQLGVVYYNLKYFFTKKKKKIIFGYRQKCFFKRSVRQF